ncbi:MAG: AAA family ATPase, partial [Bacillota bacterium]
KAAAKYTDSTFTGVSGSEFIEMYAGVGAKRIRELFSNSRKKAKKEGKKSAVIFIDEIEILGGKRGKNSSHLEYDQTLNQLLVELDGLTIDDEIMILVIAATNRKDILDKSLLRPGRFDRIVSVNLPAKLDRLEILKIHTNNKPLAENVNLNKIASETFMFSGAHLESLANEAAILAMRNNKNIIEQKDFEEAIDKVIMGEKLNRKPKDKDLKRISIHEAGHALISELLIPDSVSTINISSRGKALGYVRHNEQEDILLKTRDDLYNEISIALAGALAEKIILNNKSTGATNDYKKVIQLINKVISSGISELGIINKEKLPENILYQEEKKIIKKLTNKVEYILRLNKGVLNKLAELLLEEEKISGEKLKKLMKNENAKVNI